MSLPPLTNLEPTAQELRKAAQVIAALRLLELEHSPHYLEFSLNVKPEGLSTAALPLGGDVILDFQQAAMIVNDPAAKSTAIPLAGHGQPPLFEAVPGMMSSLDLSTAPPG